MRNLAISGILLMALTFACKKDNNTLYRTTEIKYGESKVYADYNLTINLDSVLSDSRCPQNVNCIWAGNAEVRFIYSKDDKTVKFVLNTLTSFRTDTLIYGYRIKLVDLTPYPEVGVTTEQIKYKAELKVIKE